MNDNEHSTSSSRWFLKPVSAGIKGLVNQESHIIGVLFRPSPKAVLYLAIGLAVLVFLGSCLHKHQRFVEQTENSLKQADSVLTPLIWAYTTGGPDNSYETLEVLELIRSEAQSISSEHPSSIYLQVINKTDSVYYSSLNTSNEVGEFSKPSQVFARAAIHREEVLPLKDAWVIRTGVTMGSYLWPQAQRFMIVGFLTSLSIVSYFSLGQAYRRRRFGTLVTSMLRFLRLTNEETLVESVPQIVAHMLDFDAVGLYLMDKDRIVPRAAYLPEGSVEAFLRSTDVNPIKVGSNYPEARAVEENRVVRVNDPYMMESAHPEKYEKSGRKPYIIAVMKSKKKDKPFGLLTAQRHRGLHDEHEDFLNNAAQLVALLLENFRARDAQERMYRQVIRNTQKVSIGTVVPFVAHNMKTPLSIIAQLTKSIRLDIEDSVSPEEIDARLNRIKSQADHCFELLRSISDYNKLGGSSRGYVLVDDALDKVCDFFKEYFIINDILLNKDYAERRDSKVTVEIEELDFIQVVTNLLINAAEAFEEAKEHRETIQGDSKFQITVETALMEDSKIAITVFDNGPGIPEENLESIFDGDFTTKEYGSGVGLPYCRRVVEQAHGTLEVSKSPSGGASFVVSLPTVVSGVEQDQEQPTDSSVALNISKDSAYGDEAPGKEISTQWQSS